MDYAIPRGWQIDEWECNPRLDEEGIVVDLVAREGGVWHFWVQLTPGRAQELMGILGEAVAKSNELFFDGVEPSATEGDNTEDVPF